MNIQLQNCKNLPIIIIDDFYSSNELALIWSEIKFLSENNKLKDPSSTGSASYTNEDNQIVLKKKNLGICLDDIYLDRNVSNILKLNRKIFDVDVCVELSNLHSFFHFIPSSNKDITILHYFNNGDYYLPHHDDSVISIITYFNIEPKKFTGGDLLLEDEIIVEPKNNRVVIFPSILNHAVSKVFLNEINEMSGRYAISQFLYIESKYVKYII